MAKPTEDNVTDFHREVSLSYLRSSPAFAMRTPRGQKDPGAIQWDPKTNSREKSNQTIYALERSNDNIGVHLFGPVVDVDVDTDNPYMCPALDHFLPFTPHVYGRHSRPRTHRLYELSGANATFDPAAYSFLTRVQGYDPVALEVRGGDLRSGRYSLMPGSVHPSGEMYTWHDFKAARSTPIQTDLGRLMHGIRLACVAAALGIYWVEGVRNELCKALCGFMYRASCYADELNVDMPFDKDAARNLLEGILQITDDEEDKNMRMRTFEQTWEKAERGDPVVGATKLTEITGDEKLLPLLYALLAHTPDLQRLDELFEQYVVLRNSTSLVDLNLGARGNYVMNKEAFTFTLQGQYLTTAKGKVPLSLVFTNSMQRTIVDTVAIDPSRPKIYTDEVGLKCANVWSGWAIEPCQEEVRDHEVEPVLRYFREVLARGDEEAYEWVMMWVADIFQNPASKPGTMLVLVGEQGAGKTFLVENMLRPIIGDAHCTKASTTEKLTSKFNAHMSGKLLIQGEEVLSSNKRSDAEVMKDLVTSRKRMIEFKGRDAFEMVDHARYVLTSNNLDNAVNVGRGDRRTTILHVSDDYAYMDGRNAKRHDEFWSEMFRWVEDKDGGPHQENLAKLHRYLLQIRVDRKKIRVAHETDAKRATRINSVKGLDAWLYSMLEKDNPLDGTREYGPDKDEAHSFVSKRGRFVETRGWPEYVRYTRIESSFRQFSSRAYGEERSAQQIIKYFKDNKLIDDADRATAQVGGVRVRIRPFPPRHRVVKFLHERGFLVDLNETTVLGDTPDDANSGIGASGSDADTSDGDEGGPAF